MKKCKMIKSIQSIIWGSNVVKIWINNRKVPAYLNTTGILWVLIDRSADNYYQTITVEARCETYFISLNFKQNFNRYWAFPSGSLVKNSPAKQEMWIQSLDQERPLEKAMATHSSILAWKIPWTEEPCRLRSMGLLWVECDWAASLSLFTFTHWRRKWEPTPVFLPAESQEQWSLVCCRLWVRHNWSDLAAAAAAASEI